MFTEIIVARSVKVFVHPGFPEQWVKAGGTVPISEGQDPLEIFDKAYDKLGEALKKEVNKIAPDQPPAPVHIPPQGENPERVDFRKRIAKAKTLSDLNHFAKEAKTGKMLDIYNERKNQINGKMA